MILPDRNSPLFRFMIAAFGLLVVAGSILLFMHRPRISEQRVRERVVATMQRESRESFLVTGSLDLTVTLTRQNTKVLLPGLLDLSLGEARTTVQVPGRVYYGFDVRKIRANDIHLRGDTVVLRVPAPSLLSVDVNLSELRVQTSKGWLRTRASVLETEREAVRNLNSAFARQAAEYISASTQPRVNTARALEVMLRPPLAAAGLRTPYFRFALGQQIQLESAR